MRAAGSIAALALTSLAACRDPGARPAPVASGSGASSEPPASPVPGGPVVSSELEVRGMRVRSGTLAPRGADAQARGLPSSLWGFTALGIDTEQLRLEIVRAARGAPLARLLPEGALAVVNGGYFEADFSPSTWLKSNGVELAKKSDTSKGGVLALRDGLTYVGPFAGLSFEPTLAVQSFPLIVETPSKIGIHRDDGRRAARTIVCLVDQRLELIVIAAPRGDGPTLYESAMILAEAWPRGFGCSVALNLDGGPSAGVWFSPEVPAKQRAPVAPVAYALAIVPRG